MTDWPKLSQTIKPIRGQHIAVVHETMADIMLLIDLDKLYVIMSDSDFEKYSNEKYIQLAHGDVLILGFGLGFNIVPISKKPEVTSVTVLEIEPEVISLVASQIALNEKVKIIIGDALTYKPDRFYDCIFWDIDPSPQRVREVELSGINTEPVSAYSPYLKPGGIVEAWNGDYGRYRN
jgi:spermidine synthase